MLRERTLFANYSVPRLEQLKMTPIRETDGDRHQMEFFRPEFISRRLGKPGQWQGGIAVKLRLQDPVTDHDFSRLLQGRTPEDEALRLPFQEPRVRGWRFTLGDEGSVNVLWALSPPGIRGKIQLAHNQAVRAAINGFENGLNGKRWFEKLSAVPRKLTLFAKFQSGASRTQAPRLETNVFLFNFILQRGQPVEKLSSTQVRQEEVGMQSIYREELRQGIKRALGAYIELPKEVCHWIQNASYPTQAYKCPVMKPGPLQGPQLFDAWREQGRISGWGPEKVLATLREARLRFTCRNWLKDWLRVMQMSSLQVRQCSHSPLRIIEAMEKGSHLQPHTQPQRAQQNKDMGHSH